MNKKKIQFLTFNDGVINVFDTDDDDEIISDTRCCYKFGERTVGVKRFYEAYQHDIELVKVIHIHYLPSITTQKAAVIGETRYNIEQVQHDKNAHPRCTVLSLSQRGLYEGEYSDL